MHGLPLVKGRRVALRTAMTGFTEEGFRLIPKGRTGVISAITSAMGAPRYYVTVGDGGEFWEVVGPQCTLAPRDDPRFRINQDVWVKADVTSRAGATWHAGAKVKVKGINFPDDDSAIEYECRLGPTDDHYTVISEDDLTDCCPVMGAGGDTAGVSTKPLTEMLELHSEDVHRLIAMGQDDTYWEGSSDDDRDLLCHVWERLRVVLTAELDADGTEDPVNCPGCDEDPVEWWSRLRQDPDMLHAALAEDPTGFGVRFIEAIDRLADRGRNRR